MGGSKHGEAGDVIVSKLGDCAVSLLSHAEVVIVPFGRDDNTKSTWSILGLSAGSVSVVSSFSSKTKLGFGEDVVLTLRSLLGR